ncbi:D-alanyl-D-alanine carboxypeptidase [Paenibacillus sp. IB182496]|uniref:D-alanyl-D-alanine carboxypeptidase n=1 Tax=Paenibacillus sabuli TaxID=2772509 RepID=A0A927BU16_9BACL|nr:D-alanyl-D-alanine carboxypeptidase family protein [Paenibacillus sabuli]MBD2846807.1 D-alanyl-D-alanine carboxypeptidase [Paenibacillus sabuli]
MIHSRIRMFAFVLAVALTLASFGPGAQGTRAQPQPIFTNAKAAALIDVTSGRLLYSQRGDESMLIASLTKIMTAIVAIEHGELSDIVKTSTRAAGKEGSSIYLKAGEEMSLEHMLYGLMLRSGNDAATAIAEHVGGSEEGFVHLMNEKAIWLGLEHTHFMNPHGLDHEEHYSSANDLAKLTAYALHNEVFREIVKTKQKSVPNPNEEWDHQWRNKNKMLSMYEGADGVKTGYTKKALRTLVSSATRNGQQLVAVTLNDGDDWRDHRKLLDWGFASYPLTTLVEQGQRIAGTAYRLSRSFQYPLAEEEQDQIRRKLVLTDTASADYRLGERGALALFLGERPLGTVAVETAEAAFAEAAAQPGAGKAAAFARSAAPGFASMLQQVVRQLFR